MQNKYRKTRHSKGDNNFYKEQTKSWVLFSVICENTPFITKYIILGNPQFSFYIDYYTLFDM